MKKKIISVVLVMTMVFALFAVSASARPQPEPVEIESVTVTGIPAKIYVGDTDRNLMAAAKVAISENYYVADVNIWTKTGSKSSIDSTGEFQVGFTLAAKNGYCFKFKEGDDSDAVFGGTAIFSAGVTPDIIYANDGYLPEAGETADTITIFITYKIENADTRPTTEPLFVPGTPIESVTIKMPSELTKTDTGKSVVDGIAASGTGYSLFSATLFDGSLTDITNSTSALTAGSYSLKVYLDAAEGYYFKYKTPNYIYDGAVLTTPDGNDPTDAENVDESYAYVTCYNPATDDYGEFNANKWDIGMLPTRVELWFEFTIEGEAPVPPTPIESIAITIPETLAVGNNIATLISGVSENNEYYSIEDVYFYKSSEQTTGTIDAGDWYLYVILKAEEGYTFEYEFDTNAWDAVPKASITPADTVYYEVGVSHDKATHTFGAASEDKTSGNYIVAEYKYTVTGDTPIGPDPGGDDPIGPTPGGDGDFNLFDKIFGFISWKKFMDDVKTFSILSVIFKLLEAIAARISTFIN